MEEVSRLKLPLPSLFSFDRIPYRLSDEEEIVPDFFSPFLFSLFFLGPEDGLISFFWNMSGNGGTLFFFPFFPLFLRKAAISFFFSFLSIQKWKAFFSPPSYFLSSFVECVTATLFSFFFFFFADRVG